MKKTAFKVGGKSYPIKYGFGALRLLGAAWGLKSFNEILERINATVKDLQGGEILLDAVSDLADIVLAGIYNYNKDLNRDLDPDDVATAILEDPTALVPVVELLVNSMPQEKPQPKAEKAGKR